MKVSLVLSRPPYGYVGASALAFTAALAVHGFVLRRSPFMESAPHLGGFFLVESALLLASSGLLVAGLVAWSRPAAGTQARGTQASDASSADRRRAVRLFAPASPAFAGKKLALIAILGAFALCVALYATGPLFYARMALEDGIVENVSALLAGAAGLLFLAAVVPLLRKPATSTRWPAAGAGLLALAAMLLAMEEVSWFQRVADIETPASFAANEQQEMNLHNFDTDLSENVYYLGSFLLLTFLPFAWVRAPASLRRRAGALSLFVPSLFLTYFSAVTTAYLFDMWNVPHMQFAFFLAAAMLIGDLPRARRCGEAKYALATLGLLLATQATHLARGMNEYVGWELPEYRELFIPAGLVAYAFQVYRRARQR